MKEMQARGLPLLLLHTDPTAKNTTQSRGEEV